MDDQVLAKGRLGANSPDPDTYVHCVDWAVGSVSAIQKEVSVFIRASGHPRF